MEKSKYDNPEYWEERIANETWKTYNSSEDKNRALIEMYDKTNNSIKKELYTLAEQAEVSGALTRTQQYRFNKLIGQQGLIFNEIEKLGSAFEKHGNKQMSDSSKAVYGNVMESLGINDYSYPNKKQMEQMMRSPWKGSFFSERVWTNMDKLQRNLNGVINDGMATGKTTTEMAVSLSNIMQSSFNDAHRLVRTETINAMNRSAINGYKDAGIKKVQWWAAEDERTCPTCGSNHSKKYDINKAPILPCHPGCRCTWIPIVDKEFAESHKLDIESNRASKKINYQKELKLSDKEMNAVNSYVSSYSYKINDKLRYGNRLTSQEKEFIKDLDSALDKFPNHEGSIIRTLDFYFEEDRTLFLESFEVGDTRIFNEYLSTSKKKGYNENANVLIHIKSKNGNDISVFNWEEKEVLFARNSKFLVVEKVEKDGVFNIWMEEME